MDDRHHDNAHHHGHKGGPQVVGHSDEAQPTGALGIQGGQSRHQAAGGADELVKKDLSACFLVSVILPKCREDVREFARVDTKWENRTFFSDHFQMFFFSFLFSCSCQK